MSEIVTKDMDGNDLLEGDRVMAFQARYETTRIEDNIYEEHHDRPLPTRDVPLFIGSIYWSKEMLAWWIKVEKILVEWETKPCGIAMGGGSYLYQKMP